MCQLELNTKTLLMELYYITEMDSGQLKEALWGFAPLMWLWGAPGQGCGNCRGSIWVGTQH